MLHKRVLVSLLATAALALPHGHATASEANVYTYDALGRVTAVGTSRSAGTDASVTISYDAASNRSNYAVSLSPPSGGAAPPSQPPPTMAGTPSPPPPPPPSPIPPPPANNPPIAKAINAGAMGKCTVKNVSVEASVSDPDDDLVTLTGATASGDMIAYPNGALIVTIESGQTSGTKSISYSVADGSGGTTTSTITVSVQTGVCN